jgi:hypothetical protein
MPNASDYVSVSCTDAYIGTAPVITINLLVDQDEAQDAPYIFTVRWEFGSQSGTIATRTTQKRITNYYWSESFFNEIPDRMSAKGAIYVDCYDAKYYMGTIHTDFTVLVNPSHSAPTISLPSVTDKRTEAIALTGSNTKFIRYVSSPLVNVTATAHHAASIADVYIENGGTGLHGSSVQFTSMSSPSFSVQATDTRGLVTSITYTIPAERFIEYVKLTCNIGNDLPDTDGKMRLTCSGNYFNGSFGAANNTLTVQYRYKEKSGDFGEWTDMTASISGNAYSAYANLTGLEYRNTYVFECRATDAVATVSSADKVAKALPVFDWGENDFNFNVPVNFSAGIMCNGNESDIIVEQGTTGIWTWRKWQSGFAECWGRFTKSVYGSDWTAWGSLYQATIVQGHEYPFTFTDIPKEFATLHSASGGMLNGSAWTLSTSTTGDYYIVHPNKLTSTYSCLLDLYVVGRWK